LQEKTNKVFQLIPMDLFDKAKNITMISLSILYNTNLVPLAICLPTLAIDPEQQKEKEL
jgi:hypothetical protein